MAILITGAAGFIGAHVTEQLLNSGADVVALDDLSGGFAANVPAKARFVEGSILDVALLDKLFADYKFEYVFHLAAYAAEGLSHFIRRFNYENNLIGSMNLINASVNTGTVKCFVFTSSIAVYGAGQGPMSERLRPEPEDPYGVAKFAVEQDLSAARRIFGLSSIVFRPHNVYGEKQNLGDRYRNVIGIFMNQLMSNEPMTIFGNGEQTRAFTYIGDVAPVLAQSIHTPKAYNQIFNIGADKAISVNTLAAAVAKAMGKPCDVKHLDPRNEVQHAIADHSRLESVFGYSPRFDLDEGLGRMAKWAVKSGPKKPSVFGAIEVEKNLPPSWRTRA
ncbi:MAG: NAD-dependent epimerase/dehydratase family protein [Myxococcaceae bacterium]